MRALLTFLLEMTIRKTYLFVRQLRLAAEALV
jgi:hypothetical protein